MKSYINYINQEYKLLPFILSMEKGQMLHLIQSLSTSKTFFHMKSKSIKPKILAIALTPKNANHLKEMETFPTTIDLN